MQSPVSGRWRVLKFGGSSVADAACFRRVADIVEREAAGRRLAAVLSAAKGVTDALLAAVARAERREDAAFEGLEALRERHRGLAAELLSPAGFGAYAPALDDDVRDVRGVLQTAWLLRSAPGAVRDVVAGYGELWSTRLFARLLDERGALGRPARWLDAREVVVVDWGPLGPRVQWAESERRCGAAVAAADDLLVVPGFVAVDRGGVQTTLGRNGSDFSASIFGALLAADEIQIWTDVSGVLSADPRRVPEARVIEALSYNEAMELAYFGAKVIHPQTMAPAVGRDIPIYIKNTFAPEAPGTLIAARPPGGPDVKGITTVDHVALLNLEGAGMIGVPGTASRLFAALRDAEVSVVLISQGSSEHSICFAIPRAQAAAASAAVRRAFEAELREGQIQRLEAVEDCSIVAVVGDGMAGRQGVAARLFASLAGAGVNVRAIAQGSSERNISVVVDAAAAPRALRAAHAGFYLSSHTVSVGLVGPGLVGSTLLDQIAGQAERLRRDCKLDLRVRAVAGSKAMLLDDAGVDLGRWRARVGEATAPADLDAFARHVRSEHLPHAIIVDCTASAEVAARYADWLAAGVHVVTPNKRAGSGPLDAFDRLHEARRAGGGRYLYEATVGAGLPIIQTLRDLRETGDEIACVEGILSGTLSYLFNGWTGEQPFSALVRAAKARGFTEPHPAEDLSGADVARKLVILGREMGLRLELGQVRVESLVPPSLEGLPVDEFLDRLADYDAPIGDRLGRARARGRVLRYVGRLDASGEASVGLVELEPSHPFVDLNPTDNVVRFVTQRYRDNPLVVQGPGAGPAVTAAGVFADILRVCAYLGAHLA
ncbi:MAG TPA: bifunctional aspartate kinase/homoserine dehydrogenase I [Polyangiaceae bacterium]|nr:bifunctional aspartate kinase/homoserine dehydrogenase I [Polyangiaceae bacterium]